MKYEQVINATRSVGKSFESPPETLTSPDQYTMDPNNFMQGTHSHIRFGAYLCGLFSMCFGTFRYSRKSKMKTLRNVWPGRQNLTRILPHIMPPYRHHGPTHRKTKKMRPLIRVNSYNSLSRDKHPQNDNGTSPKAIQ